MSLRKPTEMPLGSGPGGFDVKCNFCMGPKTGGSKLAGQGNVPLSLETGLQCRLFRGAGVPIISRKRSTAALANKKTSVSPCITTSSDWIGQGFRPSGSPTFYLYLERESRPVATVRS